MSEEVMIPKSYHDKVCEEIIRFKDKQFYDAVHLLDDGTLEITVGDYTKVKRVLVEDYNNFGNLFYEDKADRPQGEWSIDSIDEIELSYGGTAYEPVYKCSHCGRTTESYVRFDKPLMPEDADFPNFCGWCGARMKGADE